MNFGICFWSWSLCVMSSDAEIFNKYVTDAEVVRRNLLIREVSTYVFVKLLIHSMRLLVVNMFRHDFRLALGSFPRSSKSSCWRLVREGVYSSRVIHSIHGIGTLGLLFILHHPMAEMKWMMDGPGSRSFQLKNPRVCGPRPRTAPVQLLW